MSGQGRNNYLMFRASKTIQCSLISILGNIQRSLWKCCWFDFVVLHPFYITLVSWMTLLVKDSLLPWTISAPLKEQKTLKTVLPPVWLCSLQGINLYILYRAFDQNHAHNCMLHIFLSYNLTIKCLILLHSHYL